MAEPVFEIDALASRAVQLLRDRAAALPTGTVATELGVPLWAADRALEQAYAAGQVAYESGVGWSVRASVPAAAQLDDQRHQQFMNFTGEEG